MADRQSWTSRATCLRVGLIHWAFAPTTGGVESHLADTARLLARKDCSVTVITGEPAPTAIPGVQFVTNHLMNLDFIRSGTNKGDAYLKDLRHMLTDVICERRLEVIHGHNLHHFAPEPALILDQLRPFLRFRLHHTFHETWPDMLHERPVYRHWDGNYAVSRFVQDECASRLGFRPRLLRLCVDTSRFRTSRQSLSDGRTPVILHPARLLPWKGVHVSVQMLAALRRRGVHAKLILTDTARIADWNQELTRYRKEILQLIAALDLQDLVEFRPVSYAEMPLLYEEADIVIYPTVGDEPFGLVPLESMSCKRPIVASLSGGIAETIVHDQTGFVFERENAEALRGRISQLLGDPELARRMGVAGRAHVVRHFDMQPYVASLLGLYQGRA